MGKTFFRFGHYASPKGTVPATDAFERRPKPTTARCQSLHQRCGFGIWALNTTRPPTMVIVGLRCLISAAGTVK